jgi:hypothetical protein
MRLVRWLLRWPQTYPAALPRVSPHSPQSSIPVSTGPARPICEQVLTFGTKVSDKHNPAYAGRAGGGIPSGPALAPSGAKPIHGAGGDALSRRHAQRFAARSASLRRLAPL